MCLNLPSSWSQLLYHPRLWVLAWRPISCNFSHSAVISVQTFAGKHRFISDPHVVLHGCKPSYLISVSEEETSLSQRQIWEQSLILDAIDCRLTLVNCGWKRKLTWFISVSMTSRGRASVCLPVCLSRPIISTPLIGFLMELLEIHIFWIQGPSQHVLNEKHSARHSISELVHITCSNVLYDWPTDIWQRTESRSFYFLTLPSAHRYTLLRKD